MPRPTTSQTVPPRSSTPTRMCGSADCWDPSDTDVGFWLSFELSLERELEREHHRRIVAEMESEELDQHLEVLLPDYHMTKWLLKQHVQRVCELECRLALIDPAENARYDRWAAELLADREAG